MKILVINFLFLSLCACGQVYKERNNLTQTIQDTTIVYEKYVPFNYTALGVGKIVDEWEEINLSYVDINSLDTIELPFPIVDNFAKNKQTKYLLNKTYKIYHSRGEVMRERMQFYKSKEDGEYLSVLGKTYSLDSLFECCFVTTHKDYKPYIDFQEAAKMVFNKQVFLIISSAYRLNLSGLNNNFYLFFDITTPKNIKAYVFSDTGEGNFAAFHHYDLAHNFGYVEKNEREDTLHYYTLEKQGWQKQPYYAIVEYREDFEEMKVGNSESSGIGMINTKLGKWFIDIKKYSGSKVYVEPKN
jgi:hypothetical protein